MITELTLNISKISENWTDIDARNRIIDRCKTLFLESLENKIPVYQCDDYWIDLCVYNEFEHHTWLGIYGYCDTQASLIKYLKPYVESETNYFVKTGFMDMNYEKYYKNGSYINKDGIDTGDDYYSYIDENPEMKINQEFDGKWLTFSISELLN